MTINTNSYEKKKKNTNSYEKQKTQTVMKYQTAPFSLPLLIVFAFHKIYYVFLTTQTTVHNE